MKMSYFVLLLLIPLVLISSISCGNVPGKPSDGQVLSDAKHAGEEFVNELKYKAKVDKILIEGIATK